MLERVAGIEPAFLAWEATFLPLEDTRVAGDFTRTPHAGKAFRLQLSSL
jgi:hypothetical protein